MTLNERLLPPTFDAKFLDELVDIAERAQSALEERLPTLPTLVEEFNARANTMLAPQDFLFYGWTDAIGFVRAVVSGARARAIRDVTRAELVEIVTRLLRAPDVGETDHWLGLLTTSLPNCNVSDLIYWPNEYFKAIAELPPADPMSPEEIVSVALRAPPRRVFHMGPPSEGDE